MSFQVRKFETQHVPKPFGNFDFLKDMDRPFTLEIGAGTGDFAFDWCSRNPDKKLVAIEKTQEKIKKFKNRFQLQKENFNNLYPVHANATHWVPHFVAEKSLEKIYINYQNPYPKAAQANKRFHNMSFFGFLISKLVDGGSVEFATNIKDMHLEIKAQMKYCWSLQLTDEKYLTNAYLAKTAFEKKYLETGQTCYRTCFVKN
jgi:tRNA (guanine-N7-)-methyltransferase